MKLNKVYTTLFVSLAVMAGSAHADAIGDVAKAATSIFGSSKVNTDVTIGSFSNGSHVNADQRQKAEVRKPWQVVWLQLVVVVTERSLILK